MRRRFILACSFAISMQYSIAQAQVLHPDGVLPQFEVATIKPWVKPDAPPAPPLDGGSGPGPVKVVKVAPVGGVGQTTNRVRMILPISLLIASAYNLPVGSENRLVVGPAWLRQDSAPYEIQAKIDDLEFAAMRKMTPLKQRERIALMEQALLIDRCKLKVHFEQRELPIYSLVVAKGGAKLAQAAEKEASRLSTVATGQGMKMTATAVSMQEFARSPLLTGPAGSQVADETGLQGLFSFTLQWDAERLVAVGGTEAADDANLAPSLFTAMQKQLGIRLVPSKAQAEVIVIDHIEPPSAN